MKNLILIDNYSDKAIAVIGDTFPHKEFFKGLNGAFNPRLKYNNLQVVGWIFSKKRLEALKQFIGTLGTVAESLAVTLPEPVAVAEVIKPIVKTVTKVKAVTNQFNMRVIFSGFIDQVREFTNEAEMIKYLKQIRGNREKQIAAIFETSVKDINKYGVRLKIGHKTYSGSRDRDISVEDIKEAYKQNGVSPLIIKFEQI